MASITFDSFYSDLGAGAVVPTTDTYKVMLVTSTYAPNKGTHTKRSDVTNEVVGTGYTAGGQTVVCTVAINTTTHLWTFTPATSTWPGSTITARGAVVYKSRGGLATADNLVCYEDFGVDTTSTGAVFTVTITAPLAIQN